MSRFVQERPQLTRDVVLQASVVRVGSHRAAVATIVCVCHGTTAVPGVGHSGQWIAWALRIVDACSRQLLTIDKRFTDLWISFWSDGWIAKIDLIVKHSLLDERQYRDVPTKSAVAIGAATSSRQWA